jgi:hypothetical protein
MAQGDGDAKHGQPVDTYRIMVRAGIRGLLEALKKRLPDRRLCPRNPPVIAAIP